MPSSAGATQFSTADCAYELSRLVQNGDCAPAFSPWRTASQRAKADGQRTIGNCLRRGGTPDRGKPVGDSPLGTLSTAGQPGDGAIQHGFNPLVTAIERRRDIARWSRAAIAPRLSPVTVAVSSGAPAYRQRATGDGLRRTGTT
jgi:hypothetical protein